MNKLKLEEDFYFFKCPNCLDEVIVNKNELNCRIFRHGVYKNNYTQVNPHLSFEECEKLRLSDLIYGCCKPFEIVNKENVLYALNCEYK